MHGMHPCCNTRGIDDMAAKNEARIKFTADTAEFNSQIKQANTAMSGLRAEMKLNDGISEAEAEAPGI